MLSSPDFLAEPQEQRGEFQELQNPQGDLHLRFYIPSGLELALPAIGIREVVSPSPDRITPVPNASPLLLGVFNLRGQVIWVADLGQFLGETPLNTDRGEIPVIAIEDEEITLGLAVGQIIGMDWLDGEQMRLVSDSPDNMAPFLRGEWVVDGQTNRCLRLLDPIAILRSARWAA
uniref:CheW protein n=1 Tax=Cyanothece sp. (strain PCC 7425 / ATCC 29141) TaxID=395961 RepID=B8HTI4_CYAP4